MRLAIRVDAVKTLTKEIKSLAEFLIEKKIPATYALIPGQFDHEVAEFFLAILREHPRLVAVVPYGWLGKNYGTASEPGEFGSFRSRIEQWEDIKRSTEKMDRVFMHRWSRVFVLPSGGADKNTDDLLRQASYKAVSGRYRPSPKRLIADLGASMRIKSPKLAKEIVSEAKFLLNAREAIILAVEQSALAGVYLDEMKKTMTVLAAQGVKQVLLGDLAGISLEKVI